MKPLRVLLVGSDLLGNRILTDFVRKALGDIAVDLTSEALIRREYTTAAEKSGGISGYLARRSLFFQTSVALRRDIKEKPVSSDQFDVIVCVTFSALLALPFYWRNIPAICVLDAGAVSAHIVAPKDKVALSLVQRLSAVAYNFVIGRREVTWCFLSSWACEAHQKVFGFRREHVVKLPPPSRLSPISEQQLKIVSDRKRHSTEKLRVLFVGNYVREKGGFLLMDLISKNLSHCCHLTIVTGQSIAPVDDSITVRNDIGIGDSDVLVNLMQECDLFVLPGTFDLFGFAPLEAMSQGLAVIMSDLRAGPDLVEHGVSGYLLDCGRDTRTQLLAMLTELSEDRSKVAQFGVGAWQRQQRYFSKSGFTKGLALALKAEARSIHR